MSTSLENFSEEYVSSMLMAEWATMAGQNDSWEELVKKHGISKDEAALRFEINACAHLFPFHLSYFPQGKYSNFKSVDDRWILGVYLIDNRIMILWGNGIVDLIDIGGLEISSNVVVNSKGNGIEFDNGCCYDAISLWTLARDKTPAPHGIKRLITSETDINADACAFFRNRNTEIGWWAIDICFQFNLIKHEFVKAVASIIRE